MSRVTGNNGKIYDTDQVATGNSVPTPITGTSAVKGNWKVLKAVHGNAVIATNGLEIDGVVDTRFNNWQLDQGDPIPFGTGTITSLTLSSGDVLAW